MLSRSSAVIVSLTSLSRRESCWESSWDEAARSCRPRSPGPGRGRTRTPSASGRRRTARRAEGRRRRDLRRPGQAVRAVPAGQPDVRAGGQGGLAVGGSHRRPEDHPAEESRRVRQFEETGSGVIVRSDRAAGLFVLTNHHVVDGAEPSKIRVLLARRPFALAGQRSGPTPRPTSPSSSSTATTCRRRGWATATRPRSGPG